MRSIYLGNLIWSEDILTILNGINKGTISEGQTKYILQDLHDKRYDSMIKELKLEYPNLPIERMIPSLIQSLK